MAASIKAPWRRFESRRRVLIEKSNVRLAGMRVADWGWIRGVVEKIIFPITVTSCLVELDLAREKAEVKQRPSTSEKSPEKEAIDHGRR